MHYRTLGQTGLQVSEVGLGAMPFGGMVTQADGTQFGWSGTDDQELMALVHRSEALGTNLLDTAEAYGNGHGEAVVGEALQGRRHKWIVATKVQPNRGIDAETPDEAAVRKRITEACEGSLHRLRTDYIDIYQLHAIPYPWAMPVAMETLAQLRQAGKIRWYGISTNDREAIDRLRTYGPLHVLQIGYNMLERHAEALLHWAHTENIGTLIRVPLAKGMLTGKYSGPQAVAMPPGDHRYERFQRPGTVDGLQKLTQLGFLQTPTRSLVQAALRFVLDHPGVSSVIAGAKTRQQIEENTAASALPGLAPDERARALAIAETIGTPNWSR
ncbi:MAG TPA: aldo/keto reductase [Candidatus Tectomicrobia bacterium]|jgi:aryl-alcohol dehydrogenase-like predicted oxidoreductase